MFRLGESGRKSILWHLLWTQEDPANWVWFSTLRVSSKGEGVGRGRTILHHFWGTVEAPTVKGTENKIGWWWAARVPPTLPSPLCWGPGVIKKKKFTGASWAISKDSTEMSRKWNSPWDFKHNEWHHHLNCPLNFPLKCSDLEQISKSGLFVASFSGSVWAGCFGLCLQMLQMVWASLHPQKLWVRRPYWCLYKSLKANSHSGVYILWPG